MHLYAVTRGIKHDVDRFITELQGKYFPIDVKGEKMAVQCGVRPIQLWEIVVPEPSMPQLIATVGGGSKRTKNHYVFKLIKKLLGADKVPEVPSETKPLPVYRENVEIYLIGTKKDLYHKDGYEML